ncbi:unnamed protein product [Laminaria digitata]
MNDPRLEEAGNILRSGGVGVIPTDTCYTFACDIQSRKGVERVRGRFGRVLR